MLRALWNSKSGMQAMQDKMDSISNNIANVNTEGYKKVDMGFSDLLSETFSRKGYPTNVNDGNVPYTGTGVKSGEWLLDNKQGNVTETDIDTDFAIDGSGYFAVTLPNGTTAYSRAGNFSLDGQGKLVDSKGNRLKVEYNGNGTSLKKDNFKVTEDGQIYTKDGNQNIGKIPLFNAVGDDTAVPIGDNLYSFKSGSQVYTVDNSSIKQGFSEMSNVDIGTEMTDLIVAQRAFQLNSKGLQTADDMMSMINNMKK